MTNGSYERSQSSSRIQDRAVKGGASNAKGCGNLSNRHIGNLQQGADRPNFCWGELRWATFIATASAGRFKASDGPPPNQIAFKFGERSMAGPKYA